MKKILLFLILLSSFTSIFAQNSFKLKNTYFNRYSLMLNTDFSKVCTGVMLSYKITKYTSLIWMNSNGIMVSEYPDKDIRDKSDKQYYSNTLGLSFDLSNNKNFCQRIFTSVGVLSAVPESDILKQRNCYLHSNSGFIFDINHLSLSFGISYLPVQYFIGIGINFQHINSEN